MTVGQEWVGVIHTTAPQYIKGAEDLTIRGRYFLKELQRKGRIKLNEGSHECNWQVEFSQPTIEQYADGNTLNYARHDAYRRLAIDWRGYVGTDLMTEKERLMNKGPTQLINRYKQVIPNLTKSLRDNFCAELFVDGYAAGNENAIHGLESFMATGTTVDADKIAEPSDTYGGLSTALANQGGSWSSNLSTYPNANAATDWPDGQGTSEYDYLAPKILNYSSSTGWGTGASTWEENCERVMRQAVIWLTLSGGEEGRPDVALLASNLYYEFMNKLESKTRIVIPHKKANDLGFGDTINVQGVACMADFDVPANTGYIMNLDHMTICSLQNTLFHTHGPTFDQRTLSWLFAVGFYGNCKYSPKFFGKVAAIA